MICYAAIQTNDGLVGESLLRFVPPVKLFLNFVKENC